MCGIFGVIPKRRASLQEHRSVIESLFRLSEARGKDASGLAVLEKGQIRVVRKPWAASKLIKSSEFDALVGSGIEFAAVVGHARMETNGSFSHNYNNQPVVNGGMVTVHNGIIVNDSALWSHHQDLRRQFEVDTEIINALVRKYLDEKEPLSRSVSRALREVEGAFSIACFIKEYDTVVFATNTGSLYFSESAHCFVAASEEHVLRSVLDSAAVIRQLKPGWALLYDTQANAVEEVSLADETILVPGARSSVDRSIQLVADGAAVATKKRPSMTIVSGREETRAIENEYLRNKEAISRLRRCSRCVLPETMPFIAFDSEGVCNYCRTYQPMPRKGRKAFEELIESHRRIGKADCVVPFSGGRDSSYGVFYLQKELGLKPITFTYDWGMVTDLARRNIARICGKLGVENILISADIQRKRNNIRKNVSAWLRKPKLGTVPLFMAGDKQFLHYVNRVKKENGVDLDIWLGNRLENTEFKVGFCGIEPNSNKKRIDSLLLSDKLKLLAFYGISYLENPKYLNSSVFDTLFAFYSYYFAPRLNFHLLFDYIAWNEHEIEQTLFKEFDWETSPETPSTWRIGDGTAAFYNYIYLTIAGFTEVDTFRSNQVREGMIDRATALTMVDVENAPRIESMRWYHETIGLDLLSSVRAINNARKLYTLA
jgi:glucosamine--fructose-6-phosphate aminotransferase (isomerizing)